MRRYWRFLVPAVLLLAVIAVLLVNLNQNLVFFNTPTELVEEVGASDARLRLGGQVEPGSVAPTSDGVRFAVTDGRSTIRVVHSGAPQQLFQEGIGVVVEGVWNGSEFRSDSMLVKHDEQYRTDDGVYDAPNGSTAGRS